MPSCHATLTGMGRKFKTSAIYLLQPWKQQFDVLWEGGGRGRVWLLPLANDSFSCHIVVIVDTLVR